MPPRKSIPSQSSKQSIDHTSQEPPPEEGLVRFADLRRYPGSIFHHTGSGWYRLGAAPNGGRRRSYRVALDGVIAAFDARAFREVTFPLTAPQRLRTPDEVIATFEEQLRQLHTGERYEQDLAELVDGYDRARRDPRIQAAWTPEQHLDFTAATNIRVWRGVQERGLLDGEWRPPIFPFLPGQAAAFRTTWLEVPNWEPSRMIQLMQDMVSHEFMWRFTHSARRRSYLMARALFYRHHWWSFTAQQVFDFSLAFDRLWFEHDTLLPGAHIDRQGIENPARAGSYECILPEGYTQPAEGFWIRQWEVEMSDEVLGFGVAARRIREHARRIHDSDHTSADSRALPVNNRPSSAPTGHHTPKQQDAPVSQHQPVLSPQDQDGRRQDQPRLTANDHALQQRLGLSTDSKLRETRVLRAKGQVESQARAQSTHNAKGKNVRRSSKPSAPP